MVTPPDGRARVQQISALLEDNLPLTLRQRIGTTLDKQQVRELRELRERDPLGPLDPLDPQLPRDPREPRDPQDPREPRDPRGNKELPPGTAGPDRTLVSKELSALVRRALAGDQRRTVWTFRGNEAAVHLDQIRVATEDGLIFVGITLETDQTGIQELTSVFAVGSKETPAGLLAVAEERPRGDADLAATFAEAVVATSWRGLLLVAAAAAASAGVDSSGDPLVPVALTATADALIVHTIADHHLGQQR